VTIEDVVEEIVGEIEDEHDEQASGMIHLLDEGLWEADARAELDDISREIDARLVAVDDEVDTLGGLAFLLAGRILAPGESVEHPSGWRIICVEADARRMIRLRLEAPEPFESTPPVG
jgi:CBS domain containing-hemolysin-like protein